MEQKLSLKKLLLLLTLISILLPKSLSGSIDDSTRYDTISKKEINIYLAKGLQARKEVLVLRKIILLDSHRIATKDTIITKLYETNSILREDRDLYKKLYNKQRLHLRIFQSLLGAMAAAYVLKK